MKRVKIALGVLLLFVLLGATGANLKKNIRLYDITSVLESEDPVRKRYLAHLAKYDDQNDIILMVERSGESNLVHDIEFVSNVFHRVEGLSSFVSLKESEYFTYEDERLVLKPFIAKGRITAEGHKRLKDDFYRNYFVHEGEKSFLTALRLNHSHSQIETIQSIKRVKAAAAFIESEAPHLKVHTLGTQIARHHFLVEMMRSQGMVLPVVFSLIMIVMFLLFRSLWVNGLALSVMLLSYCTTVLVVLAFESGLSPFSSFSLLFVFVVATADLVHLFSKLKQDETSLSERIYAARDAVYFPCMLTTLTTVVGFLSLAFADFAPVRSFGFFCAFGAFACFFFTFYFLPWFVDFAGITFRIRPRSFDSTVNYPRIVEWISGRRRYLKLAYWSAAALLALGTVHLTVEDNLYKKFVPSHPLSQATQALHSQYGFTGSIDVMVPMKSMSEYESNEFREQLNSLSAALGQIEGVSRVRSLSGLTQDLENQYQGERSSSEKTLNALRWIGDYGLLDGWANRSNSEARLTVFLSSLETREMLETEERISGLLASHPLTRQRDARLEGFSIIRARIFASVLSSFAIAFGISLIGIFLIFLIWLRDFRLAALAMVPNLLPLVTVVGLFGYLGIHMEYNLIVLVCIVIGVGVDDTIHFLYAFRKQREKAVRARLAGALSGASLPLVGTTMIFVMTIPAFFLTNILMFHQVAFALVVALLVALISDLVILPSHLMDWKTSPAESPSKISSLLPGFIRN